MDGWQAVIWNVEGRLYGTVTTDEASFHFTLRDEKNCTLIIFKMNSCQTTFYVDNFWHTDT